MVSIPKEYTRPVYTDTQFLWSIDPIIDHDLIDRRSYDCLAYLCDVVCDPRRDLHCIFPSRDRFENPEASLPQLYHALCKSSLLGSKIVIDPGEHSPSNEHLLSQIHRFANQCKFQLAVNHEWLALSMHKKVRGGWQFGIPRQSTDSRFRYVPEYIVEFVKSYGIKDLEDICKYTGWSNQEAASAFSFVSRGWSYWQRVEKDGAEYLVHPMRWQVQLDHEVRHEPPSPGFGPAIGGVIIESIKQGRLRKDADEIVDKLARIRDNANEFLKNKGEEAFAPRKEKDRDELVKQLLAGVFWLPFNPGVKRAINWMLRLLAYEVGEIAEAEGAPSPETRFGLIVATAAFMEKRIRGVPAAATRFPMVRRLVDYPRALDMPEKTCSFCGSVLQNRICLLKGCPNHGF